MNLKKMLLVVVGILILTACNDKKIYQQYQALAKFQWAKDKVLSYKMPVKENDKEYSLGIALRFITSISHKVIKINFKMTAPSGKVEIQKSYDVIIKTEKGVDGSAMGDIADVEKPLEATYKFAEKGDYTIEITQNMEAVEFGGVQEVGVFLENKETKK